MLPDCYRSGSAGGMAGVTANFYVARRRCRRPCCRSHSSSRRWTRSQSSSCSASSIHSQCASKAATYLSSAGRTPRRRRARVKRSRARVLSGLADRCTAFASRCSRRRQSSHVHDRRRPANAIHRERRSHRAHKKRLTSWASSCHHWSQAASSSVRGRSIGTGGKMGSRRSNVTSPAWSDNAAPTAVKTKSCSSPGVDAGSWASGLASPTVVIPARHQADSRTRHRSTRKRPPGDATDCTGSPPEHGWRLPRIPRTRTQRSSALSVACIATMVSAKSVRRTENCMAAAAISAQDSCPSSTRTVKGPHFCANLRLGAQSPSGTPSRA